MPASISSVILLAVALTQIMGQPTKEGRDAHYKLCKERRDKCLNEDISDKGQFIVDLYEGHQLLAESNIVIDNIPKEERHFTAHTIGMDERCRQEYENCKKLYSKQNSKKQNNKTKKYKTRHR